LNVRQNGFSFHPMAVLTAKRPRAIAEEPKLWTYDELLATFPETNEPTELWNGEVIMSPSPDDFHQDSVFEIASLLRDWVRKNKLGKVFIPPFDMILSQTQVTQPDALYVSKARLHQIRKRLYGPADLVVEVISADSHNRDRIRKRDLYEQHEVTEYWLLDPMAGTIEVFNLTNGQYKLVGRWRAGERARSKLLKGFEVAVNDVLRSV
jgi:Uma2 family endonuclease